MMFLFLILVTHDVAALMFHTLLALMTTVETLGIKSIATMALLSSCQLEGFTTRSSVLIQLLISSL